MLKIFKRDQSKKIHELTDRELLENIYRVNLKTKKYLFLSQILSLIKIILIVIPTVFAIIYLPPVIQNILRAINELMVSIVSSHK